MDLDVCQTHLISYGSCSDLNPKASMGSAKDNISIKSLCRPCAASVSLVKHLSLGIRE